MHVANIYNFRFFANTIVRGFLSCGFCPGDFVWAVLSRGVLSKGVLSRRILFMGGGLSSRGFCPGGFVQGGFVLESCARLDRSTDAILLHNYQIIM